MTTGMTSAAPTRVLVVAHRTAATPRLLDEVRSRARRSPCSFTQLVPRPYWDPDTDEAAITLELAIPLLAEAAGGKVEGIVGDNDPFVAVQQAVGRGDFDELIISTLPAHVSRWLRRDSGQSSRRLTEGTARTPAHDAEVVMTAPPRRRGGYAPIRGNRLRAGSCRAPVGLGLGAAVSGREQSIW